MAKIQKPVILFDVDGTLINNDRLAHMRIAHLREAIKKKTIIHEFSTAIKFFLNPSLFWHAPQLLENTFLQSDYIKRSIHPDVHETLPELRKSKVLGIWSQSIKGYQMYKLKSAGIETLFDPTYMYISLYKLRLPRALTTIPRDNLLFIDDKISNVITLLNRGFQAYYINRASSDKKPYMIKTLSTLLEIF